jgi:hypothetical protein
MENLNYNERSWVIDVISEINLFANSKNLTIKRAGGEHSLGSKEGKSTLFPDLLLFSDDDVSSAIQGWEMKFPDTAITDIELISNAEEKAHRLNLNSFIVWNVKEAVLYVEKDGEFISEKNWSIPSLNSRKEVHLFQKDWKNLLNQILLFLDTLLSKDTINRSSSIEVINEKIYVSILEKFSSLQVTTIKNECLKDSELEVEISNWFDENKEEFKPFGLDKYQSISRVTIINWINRFLFAHYLKTFNHKAKIIDNIVGNSSIAEATKVFEQISADCDFMNVFKINAGFEFVNSKLWQELISLNGLLVDFRLNTISQSSFHKVIDSALLFSRSKLAGQFSTPSELASYLVGITIKDRSKNIIDLACGTGTIAKSIYELKINKGLNVSEALSTTWASDKFSIPLQLCSIALSDPKGMDEIIRSFKSDVFLLKTNQNVSFTDPINGSTITEKLPLMHAITSNLPFIRFEKIASTQANIGEIIEKFQVNSKINISRKADIYAHITLKIKDLIEEKGRIGIITSNSWLGVEWGVEFKKALLNNFRIVRIVISGQGRWFEKADVVTTIIVLEKSISVEDYEIPFVSTAIDIKNWDKQTIDDLIKNTLTNKSSENLINCNLYPLSKINLLESKGIGWNSLFTNSNWLDRVIPKLSKVSNFFEVNRGERRGWNKLFLPASGHNIESQYIKPILKNTRNLKHLVCNAPDSAFCCDLSTEELKRLGHMGTLNWINKFKNATNGTGVPLPIALAKPNERWYEMSANTLADIVISMNPDKKLCFFRLKDRSFVDQRLVRFTAKFKHDIGIYHALLNSVIGMFLLEAIGFGRGLGALDLNTTKISETMHMLNIDLLDESDKNEVISSFLPLLNRDIMNLNDELMQSDRIEFDKKILKIFKIDLNVEVIYDSLIKLHNIRLTARD